MWRSQLLEERLRATLARKGKLALTDVIDAMEGAATADLRCEKVLPYLLQVLGSPSDPTLANAVSELRDWLNSGCARLDPNRSGTYQHGDHLRPVVQKGRPRYLREGIAGAVDQAEGKVEAEPQR